MTNTTYTDPEIRCVLELPPVPGNMRNSEGSFVETRDGRLLFVYTHYTNAGRDDDEAYLAGRWSTDRGMTWSTSDDIITHVPGGNVMSVSLLRLADGRISLFYLFKKAKDAWVVLMRTSDDEAATWTPARECSPLPGLYVMNNDRAVQLRSGRIVLPVAHRTPEEGRLRDEASIACLLSDDAGQTWRQHRVSDTMPGIWTQEPAAIELNDGRLMLLCRTQVGCQYLSHSSDQGETWSPLCRSDIVSTLSPVTIKRIPSTGDLLLIWNRVDQPWLGWDELSRSPLNTAISTDDGRTWRNVKILEHDPARWYCYTSVQFLGKHVLLAYGTGVGRTHQRLSTQRMTRLPVQWFYDTP